MEHLSGGVCAPKGFKASGIHCGIRKNRTKKDLALIYSEVECATAAVYTTNKVKAAPIYVTMENLEFGIAQAMICNSGNANACAPEGNENARKTCDLIADALKIHKRDVIVASTGVIGERLNIEAIEAAIPDLVKGLATDGSNDAAEAIMTTDTTKKEIAVEIKIGGKPVKIGAIAKGSGMIHPNLGTMLSFVTTDCAITQDMLQKALADSTKRSYNRVSVDGDTSTNDMCAVMANGLAKNDLIEWQDENYKAFLAGLDYVNTYLSRELAKDGEGATKLITCTVKNARGEESAERLAKSVISSSLVKAAMFGSDANWGRVLCAMGYSKAPFRPEYVDIGFSSDAGSISVCINGAGLLFDEDLAKKILSEREIVIEIDLKEGDTEVSAWGCDLTYDYVKINGDYRT
ncbi:MAG: bifunctional glutamate N-acetyltransferase/amino-acid acetyltransferase ArgJ [Clostridiales bacterium]|nr:bifunctional glutamate N-acetyltransferase/amino-acid acetyltransferase ArgJ [Clostridiales bacterium]